MPFDPRSIWSDLSESARNFVTRYEQRPRVAAQTADQEKAEGLAEVAKQLDTPYVCSRNHRFKLREAGKSAVGCCPVCLDPHIRIAGLSEGLTQAEQIGKDMIDRLKQPIEVSTGPIKFDPDNDPELQGDLPVWAQPVESDDPADDF